MNWLYRYFEPKASQERPLDEILRAVPPDPSVMGLGIPGLDISKWQGAVDFAAAYSQDIRFILAKCGEGYKYYDPLFNQNYNQARAAGMVFGAYFFVRPGVKAVYQTDTLNQALGTRELDMLMLDCESADGQTAQTITDIIWSLASKFKNRAPRLLIYTRASWWDPHVKRSSKWQELAELHVAHWGVKQPTLPRDWKQWTIWQQGIVADRFGVSGNVDYNVWNPAVPFPGETPPPVSDKSITLAGLSKDGTHFTGKLEAA